jgi:hypothetical protein
VSTQPNDSRWSPLTKSDLSRYHPLDHWPLTRRCADHYGGAVNHLQLWWAQRATPLLRMNTLCLVGRHHWVEGWRPQAPLRSWTRRGFSSAGNPSASGIGCCTSPVV